MNWWHRQLPVEVSQLFCHTSLRRASTILVSHLRPGTEQGVGTVKLLNVCLGVFCYTSPRRARAILVNVHLCAVKHTFSIFARMSRYTRDYGQTSSCYEKGWSPSTNKQQTAKNSCSGWSRRGTRGNPAEYEGRYNHWDESGSHDSAKDTEDDAAEGRYRR